MKKATRVPPGGEYIWKGTLSLHKRVYVMNEIFECEDRVCWTGATANSTRTYYISSHFTTLKIERSDSYLTKENLL
jgi:hypothetical protein